MRNIEKCAQYFLYAHAYNSVNNTTKLLKYNSDISYIIYIFNNRRFFSILRTDFWDAWNIAIINYKNSNNYKFLPDAFHRNASIIWNYALIDYFYPAGLCC